MRSMWMRASQTVRQALYPEIAIPLVTAAIVVVLMVMVFGK